MIKRLTTAKHLLVAVVAVTLGACSSTFKSDVATFHSLPMASGEKVSILTMDPAKRDSIEFQQYAAVLGNFLRLNGYEQAGNSAPELIVGFDVTISDGREKLENRPRAGFYGVNNFYWRNSWYHGNFWGPFPFDGPRNELYARTVYHATLLMEVRKPDGELLFEGRAETDTRRNAVPEVVPLLAEALFENFPGPSGITRHVRIELDQAGR